MKGFDLEKKGKSCCIRRKYVALICLAIVVIIIAVGLGVGLSQKTSSTDENTKPLQYCQTSNNTNGDWTNFRLPDYIIPFHYDLHLEPNMDTDVYTGTVAIHLNLRKPTTHLWLHIRDTFVSAVPVLHLSSPAGTSIIGVKGCFEYTPQEYVVVEAKQELKATNIHEHYVLTLHFQGWLNGSLVGFYKTTYVENGEIRWVTIWYWNA